MLRAGKMARLGTGLAGVILVFSVSALTSAAPAAAATAASATASAVPNGVSSFLGMAAPPTTATSQYSCDLSGYGSGISPVTVSGTLTIPASVVAASDFKVTLSTTASGALPSAVVTALNGVTSFTIDTQVDLAETVNGQPLADTVELDGTVEAPTSLTALPVMTATGVVQGGFPLAGTGTVTVPATTLTITPNTSSAALAAITCTATATPHGVKVTVIPPTVGTTGPLYSCVVAIGGLNEKLFWHIPATVTTSGSQVTGKALTVTYQTGFLNSQAAAAPAASSPWTLPTPSTTNSTVKVEYAGSLPVTGAQSGKVVLDHEIDPNATQLKLSGKLQLTKAGTDRIEVPKKFSLTFSALAGSPVLVLTCTLTTTPVPVGRTIKVQKAAGAHGSTPTPTQGVEGGGIPSGAPETGGGIGASGGATAALAGVGIAVAGAGLMLGGRRIRRRRSS